jgi:hypothetical protein
MQEIDKNPAGTRHWLKMTVKGDFLYEHKRAYRRQEKQVFSLQQQS